MDEDQNPPVPAQNEPVAADSNQPTSPVDEGTTAEPQEQEGAPESVPEEEPERSEEAPAQDKRPSRAERRIRQLSEQVRQAQQPNQLYGQPQQSPQFPQYYEGQEVSPQQLQADVVQTASAIAQAQVQHQLAQRDALTNFDRDTEVLPTKFEELNPDKSSYVPELDEAIAQEYQERAFRIVGYNPQTGQPITQLDPSVRLSDIAERHIKAARAYASRSTADMRTRVAASADSTALRPSADKAPEQKFEDLSIAEMEKRLGYHRS